LANGFASGGPLLELVVIHRASPFGWVRLGGLDSPTLGPGVEVVKISFGSCLDASQAWSFGHLVMEGESSEPLGKFARTPSPRTVVVETEVG
jgi:hypothetical protein